MLSSGSNIAIGLVEKLRVEVHLVKSLRLEELKMAVVTGGFSAEKEIMLSGRTVLKELVDSRIDAKEVRVDETGWNVRLMNPLFL